MSAILKLLRGQHIVSINAAVIVDNSCYRKLSYSVHQLSLTWSSLSTTSYNRSYRCLFDYLFFLHPIHCRVV